MNFLTAMVVLAILIAVAYVAYVIDPKEDDPKPKQIGKLITQVLLWVLVVNTLTYGIIRFVLAVEGSICEPELVTLRDAGIYQTKEVHYLITGMQRQPEDLMEILPDGLTGTIKAVKYEQLHYGSRGIAEELNRDVRRCDYDKVTIWAAGTGVLATEFGTLTSTISSRTKIVLIDPCPNTLVLKPEYQKQLTDYTPWNRTLAYLMGWSSIIPIKEGRSVNLKSLIQCALIEDLQYSKPATDKVIGLIVSDENEYLQAGALKGLYSEALQETVPTTHLDIKNSAELYHEAAEKIWELYSGAEFYSKFRG